MYAARALHSTIRWENSYSCLCQRF